MIPLTVLQKYGMCSITEYKKHIGEDDEEIFWKTFLTQTDHIPHKIVELQILGKPVKDYNAILEYRELARQEINRLSNLNNIKENSVEKEQV